MNYFQTESEYEHIAHTRLKNLNFFLVNLTYRTPHLHTDFEIIQIIEGELQIKTPDEEFTIGPGEIALFNPNQLHLLQSSGASCVVLTIQVSPAFCKSYYPELPDVWFETSNLSACMPFQTTLSLIRLCMAFGCSYFEEGRGFSLKCMSDIYLLFWNFLNYVPFHHSSDRERSLRDTNSRRFREITAYIHKHYTEKITLSELAAKEGLTMTYLSHLFKQEMRISFQEYVNSLRLDHAVLLLRNTDMSLTDICLECGFSEAKYLNRHFYKIYHMTPREFRQNLAEAPAVEKTADRNHAIQYIYSPEEALAILQKHMHRG